MRIVKLSIIEVENNKMSDLVNRSVKKKLSYNIYYLIFSYFEILLFRFLSYQYNF